jgi:hypothetical protein
MRRGVIQLVDDAEVTPFTVLADAGTDDQTHPEPITSRAAWVADFGPGDRVEIERFIEK